MQELIRNKVGIMSAQAKIKVIKKGEQVKEKEQVVEVNKSTKEAAREIVSTVTNWVNDFQHRSRVDTTQAINKLFSQQTQTN